MLPGETIASGAPAVCLDCATSLQNAGYYVGTFCGCGPYARESGYYATEVEAQDALAAGDFGRAPGLLGAAW